MSSRFRWGSEDRLYKLLFWKKTYIFFFIKYGAICWKPISVCVKMCWCHFLLLASQCCIPSLPHLFRHHKVCIERAKKLDFSLPVASLSVYIYFQYHENRYCCGIEIERNLQKSLLKISTNIFSNRMTLLRIKSNDEIGILNCQRKQPFSRNM